MALLSTCCDRGTRAALRQQTPSRRARPCLGCPRALLELGSRAEAKGGGAPTGMSATAAVAGKPIHTPTSLRRKRPDAVPMAWRTSLPRRAARGDGVSGSASRMSLSRCRTGPSASRPRNEASAITSLTGLNAACPIARRRATESATLHRTSRYFCSNNPHGTTLLDGKACQWRARGVRPRTRRCYVCVRGVRGKSRLKLVKKWGTIALH